MGEERRGSQSGSHRHHRKEVSGRRSRTRTRSRSGSRSRSRSRVDLKKAQLSKRQGSPSRSRSLSPAPAVVKVKDKASHAGKKKHSRSPPRKSHRSSPVRGKKSEKTPDGKKSERQRSPPARPKTPSPPARPKSPKYRRRRTSGEIRRCKKGKRSDIKANEWDKWGYALKEEVIARPIVYENGTVPIPRVRRKDITPEWFQEHFANKCMPVIVEGVTDHWPAMTRWSIDALEERFKNVAFKVAKDDKGKKLRTKFKYYADYLRHQQDDSPLYLFETNVDDDAFVRQLVHDYEVPDIFPHDFFGLVNQDARPPYRWFCIGPKRSGTTVHTDPLGTAAWNAVTHGQKHWVLMEPQETKKRVKGKDVMRDGEDDEAIHYFDFILPRIKAAHPEMKIYEGMQNPGDVIFVPGAWWHGVLNTEDCVAITQNYCGPDNFDSIWKSARKEREKVAHLWLRNMKKFAPGLHEKALAMNRKDNFRMRHERPAGDRLSDASSSSSESSSDSSSDESGDLIQHGLNGVVDQKMGEGAHKLQGKVLTPSLPQPHGLPGTL